jgi:hypothetical protein
MTNSTLYNVSNASSSNSSNSSCYAVTSYWANMFRPIDDPDYPWLGLWLSLPIIGIWYWCTDQVRLFVSCDHDQLFLQLVILASHHHSLCHV